MNFMLGGVGLVNTTVRLLNQPLVKESVKNIAGSITLVFGLVEVYDIYQIAQGREISTETFLTSSKWVRIAYKVVIICAKISLILSAGVSRPGVFIISSVVGYVFSTGQLERVFGRNTIFALNPRHPRHIFSVAAVILALPSVIQLSYKGMNWVANKIQHHHSLPTIKSHVSQLTDNKIRFMNLFNTLTSRPVLHCGNQLIKFILHS